MKPFKPAGHHAIAAVALAAAAASTPAAVVINNGYAGTVTNTFGSQPFGPAPGLISEPGASYGEHFAGQTLATGVFDGLSGSPTANLSLLANPTLLDNIGIVNPGVIYGDLNGQVGEGALSILLQFDSVGIGFNVIGTDFGAFTAQFFARDGSLLGSITQNGILDGYYGFTSNDDRCIAGVSLTNVDPAGIGYDNVRFGAQDRQCRELPEPGSLSLAGLALTLTGALGARRRRSYAGCAMSRM